MPLLTPLQVWFVMLMLVSGTMNTLSKKVQNDSVAPGVTGTLHYFDHPWFQTFVMFLGECTCLLMLWHVERRKRKTDEEEPLIRPLSPPAPADAIDLPEVSASMLEKGPGWRVYYGLSCLDLLGTTLAGFGLIYTYASIFQMFRGSIVVFSGVFSVLFLKRKLKAHNYTGIVIVTLGLFLVGYSNVLGERGSKDPYLALLGDAFVLAGQIVNAAQFVVEEKYLKGYKLPPLRVVGMEGVFGACNTALLLIVFYFVPGIGMGPHFEDSLDALAMVSQNAVLAVMTVFYWISIAFYNYSGLSVVKSMTTVHRTLVDALRTLFVWSADLLLFYTTSGMYGEPWSPYWWMQLLGFLLLIFGTLVYHRTWDKKTLS